MSQPSIRVNITLPKDLLEALDGLTGSEKSQPVYPASCEMRIAQKKKEVLEAQLTEGYQVGKEEGLRIAEAFEAADLEGGMTIRRGEIYLTALDPVMGNEIAKTRPAVVVSNDVGNKYSGTVTVLPLTSKTTDKVYPFEVLLALHEGNLPKPSKVKTDQIRTLDRKRLVKRIGRLGDDRMEQIEKALLIHLAIGV